MASKKTVITEKYEEKQADRDRLIRVEIKVDELVGDVKELRDGLIERVAKVESRLDTLDVFHAGIPLKVIEENSDWVSNFRSTWRWTLAVFALVASLLGGFIDHLLSMWFKIP